MVQLWSVGVDLVFYGSDLVQLWFSFGGIMLLWFSCASDLVQLRFIYVGLVMFQFRCGSHLVMARLPMVQLGFYFGSELVQLWFRCVLQVCLWFSLVQMWFSFGAGLCMT